MGTPYMATKVFKEEELPRGINYLLFYLGFGVLAFLGGLAGSMLVDVFDGRRVPQWASFLAFFGLALLLGRRVPSMVDRWKGKDAQGILVYSDSPLWKSYIESRWLPAAGDRLKIINVSQNHHWKPSFAGLALEAHLADKRRPLLPVGFILSACPALIGFNGSFLDHKAGDDEQLKKKEQSFASALGYFFHEEGDASQVVSAARDTAI